LADDAVVADPSAFDSDVSADDWAASAAACAVLAAVAESAASDALVAAALADVDASLAEPLAADAEVDAAAAEPLAALALPVALDADPEALVALADAAEADAAAFVAEVLAAVIAGIVMSLFEASVFENLRTSSPTSEIFEIPTPGSPWSPLNGDPFPSLGNAVPSHTYSLPSALTTYALPLSLGPRVVGKSA